MQILLQMPDGKTVVKHIDSSTLVGDIIKGQRMNVSKGGNLLCLHQTFEQADINDGDLLSASPSLIGGGCVCRCSCNIL